MSMLKTYLISVVLGLLLSAGMSSCAHKDIECPAGAAPIEILFEWDNARDADVAGMTLFFYPTDGKGQIWRFDIAGRDGGPVDIPPGTYRMVACNNDVAGLTLEDTGRASSIRAVAARQVADSVYAGTAMLYGAVVGRLEVTPCAVRYTTDSGRIKECGKRLVRCRPDSLATCYTIAVRKATGLESVRGVSAVLAPVSSGVFLESGINAGAIAALYMPLAADRQPNSLTGSTCAPGRAAEDISAYRVSARIEKADGKIYERRIELEQGNVNIMSPHNVMIIIDDFNIPGDISSGDVGGIDAAVDGWSVVEIELGSGI